jgi:N-acetyl-gamma-glutamyl-phosphate reductase
LREAISRDDVVARATARLCRRTVIRSSTTRPGSAASPHKHGVEIGGFTLSADGKRVVVVATLDNLLKGAATQAMQNLNRARSPDEHAGIDPKEWHA